MSDQNLSGNLQAQKPEPPPSKVSDILVALSDILKAQPGFISYEQVQAALVMAGLPAQPQMSPMQKVHAIHHVMKNAMEATPPPPPAVNGSPDGGPKGSPSPKMAGIQ